MSTVLVRHDDEDRVNMIRSPTANEHRRVQVNDLFWERTWMITEVPATATTEPISGLSEHHTSHAWVPGRAEMKVFDVHAEVEEANATESPAMTLKQEVRASKSCSPHVVPTANHRSPSEARTTPLLPAGGGPLPPLPPVPPPEHSWVGAQYLPELSAKQHPETHCELSAHGAEQTP